MRYRYFEIDAVIGDCLITVPMVERYFGNGHTYIINFGRWRTNIAKWEGRWRVMNPRTDLTLDDIEIIGLLIEKNEIAEISEPVFKKLYPNFKAVSPAARL